MQTGLYDHLLTVGLQEQLSLVSNPDCIQCAPVDAEDAHSAIAQLLEHALVRCLASYRGLEGAARQKQLVDRLIATLTDQMGAISQPNRIWLNPCNDCWQCMKLHLQLTMFALILPWHDQR